MKNSEFAYATHTNQWEEWQHDYKFGALYIFPPVGIIEEIDALRKKYDPKSASYCQAHISLSEALPGPLTGEQIEELKHVLAQTDPFTMTYGPLKSAPPHPGVFYAMSPEDLFKKLRSAIHETSIFKDVQFKRAHIPPHMTIAEFITMEQTNKLLKELNGKVKEGTFVCNEIEYAIPNSDFYFERKAVFSLGEN